MRFILALAICLVSSAISAQSIIDAPQQSGHYFYYKLNEQQTLRYFKSNGAVPIDSICTALVAKVHRDSVNAFKFPEPGHYVRLYASGLTLTHELLKSRYFFYKTRGFNGEGHLYLYNAMGEKLRDVEVLLNKEKIAYNEGCGCYLFEKQVDNKIITLRRGEHFDLLRLTVPGQEVAKADKSNPYKGAKIYPGYFVFNQPKYRHFDTLKSKAFITNWKGRPIRRKVFYYMTIDGRYVQIGKTRPVTKGAYVFNFRLLDSLRLDQPYTLDIRGRDSTLLKSGSFYLEDYELSKVDYSTSVQAASICTGEEFVLYANAKDKNGLPALDTRIKWRFYLRSINQLYTRDLRIPDSCYQNLYEGDEAIDPTGTSRIQIPDSFYFPASASYGLWVQSINANGETQQQDYRLSFNYQKKRFLLSQQGLQLKAKYLLQSESAPAKAILKEYSANTLIAKHTVDLPLNYTIPNNAFRYELVVNDSMVASVYVQQCNLVEETGTRNSKQISILAKSINGDPFFYRIYDDNKLIEKGESLDLKFEKEDKSLSSYYFIYGYTWKGEDFVFEKSFHLKEKELKVDIDQPEKIFPGEEVPIGISVTNYKGQAQKDVNLTAWAVNMEFGQIPTPSMPYFGRRFPQMTQATPFYLNDLGVRKSESLNRKMVSHFKLRQYPYYLFNFPDKEPQFFYDKLLDQKPELAPFVVDAGNFRKVEMIKIDDEIRYLALASLYEPYSFLVEPGKHKIEIRTSDTLIIIDDVVAKDSFKTTFSIDFEDAEEDCTFKEASNGFFSETEWAEIRPQILLLSASPNYRDTVWLEQNEQRKYIQLPNLRQHNTVNIPELAKNFIVYPYTKKGVLQLKIESDTLTTFFNPENYLTWTRGNAYRKTPGYLSSFPLPNDPVNFNYFNPSTRQNTINQITELAHRSPLELKSRQQNLKQEDEPKVKETYVQSLLNYSYSPNLKNLLFNPVFFFNQNQHEVANWWIFSKENKEHTWIFDHKGNSQQMYINLPKGHYTSLMLQNDNHYHKLEFEVVEDHYYYINALRFDTLSPQEIEPYRKRVHELCRPAFGKTQLYPQVYPVQALKMDKSVDDKTSVLGVVRDLNNGNRLSYTEVIIEREGVFISSQMTNAWGEFLFNDLSQGTFQIKVRRNGYYYALLYNVKIQKGKRLELQVNLVPWERDRNGEIINASLLGKKLDSVRVETFYDLDEAKEKPVFQSVEVRESLSRMSSGSSYSNTLQASYSISNRDYKSDPNGTFQWNMGDLNVNNPQKDTDIGTYIIKLPGVKANDERTKGLGIGELDNREDLKANLEAKQRGRIRDNFRDYAYWIPNLVTDEEGKAYFTAIFPDNITQWQTIVPAMDGHKQTGLGLTTTKAYLPISAQMGLPRFLVEGDKANINGKIFNYTDSAANFNAQFKLNDSTFSEQKGKSETVSVLKTVLSYPKPDSIDVTFVMKTQDGFEDGEKRELQVFPSYIEKVQESTHRLDSASNLEFVAAKDEPLRVVIHNQRHQLILEKIDNLKNYHYGCNEQTASKLNALLLERNIRIALKQGFNGNEMINQMMARLAGTQNRNGSWGWWKEGEPDEWMSIYITEALGKANSAGYNSQAFNKGLRYIQRGYKTFNREAKLKAMYMLLNYGQLPDTTGLLTMKKMALNHYERLLIVNIQLRMGQKVDIQKEVIDLASKDQCGVISWSGNRYRYNSNATMTTLLAYNAIKESAVVVHQHWLQAIENGLLYGCNYRYYNTLEMASILMLASQRLNETAENRQLLINGKTFTHFPYATILPPGDSLNVNMTGKGSFNVSTYKTIRVRQASSDSNFFKVQTKLLQNSVVPQQYKMGDPITMTVQISNRIVAKHVMVEVPIPAGCSYGNKEAGRNGGEVHREYLREKVAVFFEDLAPGTHTFSIVLEPRFTGTFKLVPAQAELMYFPEKNGNNSPEVIEIVE